MAEVSILVSIRVGTKFFRYFNITSSEAYAQNGHVPKVYRRKTKSSGMSHHTKKSSET